MYPNIKIQNLLIISLLLISSFGKAQKSYDSGKAILNNEVETVEIFMVNNLPMCTVLINDKEYQFLIDTGALTVISEEIFQDLNVPSSKSISITDSNQESQDEKLTIITEIKIGNTTFENVDAIVHTIEQPYLKCMGFDGIIGANMLAKIVVLLDYQNNKMSFSKNYTSLAFENTDAVLDFKSRKQKTPILKVKIFGKRFNFDLDTGNNGPLTVENDYDYFKNKSAPERFISQCGFNVVGLYGESDRELHFEMKTDIAVDNIIFNDVLIKGSNSNLIGNKFLRNYAFIIDWNAEKIYLQRHSSILSNSIEGFGFSYYFQDGKAVVVNIITDKDVPVELGDIILSIDDQDFTNLSDEEICGVYLDNILKSSDEINVKLLRNNEIMNYSLKKQIFIP